MKILPFILILFILACETDIEQDILDSYIIIGDQEATISVLNDTTVYPPEFSDGTFFSIDLDSDGTIDFDFYGYNRSSQCFHGSEIGIDCHSEQNRIMCYDSIQTPRILDEGDTLFCVGEWLSEKFEISGLSFVCIIGGGDGILYRDGFWRGTSEKYMGLMIEKEEYLILGWIKLSFPDTDGGTLMTLHEIGYKKAAFDTTDYQ